MKVKVIDVNNSQTKVITPFRELVEFSDKIYYCFLEDSNYVIDIYIKHKGLFISVTYNNLDALKDINFINRLNEYAEDYRILIEKEKRFSLINFYVFEKLGYDTKILQYNKNEYEKEEKIRIMKIKEDKEAKEKVKKEKHITYIKEQINILKDGGNVKIPDLEYMLNFKEIKVHTRTLFAIRQQGCEGRYISKEDGTFKKGTSQKTAQMLFSLVEKIIE